MTIEGEEYAHRMVLLEFPSTQHVQDRHADPDYQEAMTYRHASSTMIRLLLQEGGDDTAGPDPKLSLGWPVSRSLSSAPDAIMGW